MSMNTDQLQSVLRALETALVLYERATAAQAATEQEVFRMAIIKGFEVAQELSFKLIKRRLRDFGYTSRRLEATQVKELFRLAAQHGLLSLAEVERWFTATIGIARLTITVKPSFSRRCFFCPISFVMHKP